MPLLKKWWFVLLALVLLAVPAPSPSQACTRVLWNDNGIAVLVGRSMDWFEDMQTNLWAFPRGIERTGLAGKNSLSWRSKYGSLAATAYNGITADGMNEKGLAVNPLWLAETDYGQRDQSIPGLSFSLAAQYFLDNFTSVDEVVNFVRTTPFQIVTGPIGSNGRPATGHLALADASGDSAIIEWLKGEPHIYHNRKYTVMTNSPPFEQQLANLKQYKAFGGAKDLPGSEHSADRFVRAARYLYSLPKPRNEREAVAYLMSVLRNVSAPFGVADPQRPNISTTRWRIVADLTNRVYYYESTVSPSVIWVNLNKLPLQQGKPVLLLDLVRDPDQVGNVTSHFQPAQPFKFLSPDGH